MTNARRISLRIALLGPTGWIGSAFAREIGRRGHHLIPVSRRWCDIYSVDNLVAYFRKSSPDCLINCAGYTGKPNVDACELDKAACLAGNAVLPGVIATACRALELPWGHVSSGCIYSGKRADGQSFTELDPPNFSFRQNNCSFYSGSKALGEEVLSGERCCYVWRPRIPFSEVDSPRNYISKLLRYDRLLDAENSITSRPEFVAAGLDCFERALPFGVYNLTNPGSVSTRQVVEMIRESGITDKEFAFFESETEFMQKAAAAPRSNCVLDSSKAVHADLKLTPVREALRAALDNWKSEYMQRLAPIDAKVPA